MADKSNPQVAVSVTGGAAEGGGLVGVQGLLTLLPALSLVLQQAVSLVLTSINERQYFPQLNDRMCIDCVFEDSIYKASNC